MLCEASEGASVKKDATTECPLTFDGVNDPHYIASRHGLTVGTYVYERVVGSSKLYKIKSIGDAVEIEQHAKWHDGVDSYSVPLSHMMNRFAVFKAEPPTKIPDAWEKTQSFLASDDAKIEAAKANLFAAIKDFEQRNINTWQGCLSFGLRPSAPNAQYTIAKCAKREVIAKCDVDTGVLQLAPTVLMKHMTSKSDSNSFETEMCLKPPLVSEPVSIYISRPSQPSSDDISAWKDPLVPFFWVGTTTDMAKANMELRIQRISEDTSFPVFVNTKPLKVNVQLLFFKGSKVVVPLKGVAVVHKKDDDEEQALRPATAAVPKKGKGQAKGPDAAAIGKADPVPKKTARKN